MKRVLAMMLALMMVLSMTACGGYSADDGKIKIAIVQQLDHSSLDEIRVAIEAELNAPEFEVKVYNGQNDASVMNQIGTDIMSEGFDMIIPIATTRSEERRVGKECRSRWSPYH